MLKIDQSRTLTLGARTVKRLGYGAMRLAGPGVFGPPKDPDAARAVLREAVASGVNHIDTSDYYGPHVTNRLIREALHPYPDGLTIVTKIGARRGEDASWLPAFSPAELTQAVHDNLRNLGLDVLEVVNLRIMIEPHGPAEGSTEAPLAALAELQRQGLALLWQILRGMGFPNQFFCDSWVVGFWRGRPWLAGHWIGETNSDVGSSRFWIGWVIKPAGKCVRFTYRG
jgi:aryl-alcohol dehydrogenase-like predicted oxidoreductase